MEYIERTLSPYIEYLPYFLIAFVSALLLTPIIGYLTKKLNIVDIPAELRKKNDPSLKTRIRKDIVSRAGGLAVIIPFIIITLFSTTITSQITAILIGVVILTILGVLDDKFQLNSKIQMAGQIIAAIVVVAAGISIDSIKNPFGNSVDLRSLVIPFSLGANQYAFVFPADIFTILWILILINAINWIFGIDALGEGVTFIALMATLFISVKYQTPLTALLSAILAGGILGFLPFNMHPSKIFSGTTGTTVYGYLIAVLSILGGVKVSTSVIVLIIPILDMIWVMVGRINKHGVTKLTDVFKVTSMGDDTHLHHRLLKLGFSVKQTALIECIAVGICAIVAFIVADLPKVTMIGIIGIVILFLFLIISILLRRGSKMNGENDLVEEPKEKVEEPKPSGPEETPESRYAY